MRIFATSDIHTDCPDNRAWIEALSPRLYRNDIIICAGDVADSTDALFSALNAFKKTFKQVFFTPGNHDLWLSTPELSALKSKGSMTRLTASRGQASLGKCSDSLEKLHCVLQECERLGIQTKPTKVTYDVPSESDLVGAVWIVPILSWHHTSWDKEPDVDAKAQGFTNPMPSVEKLFMDYSRCVWPKRIYSDVYPKGPPISTEPLSACLDSSDTVWQSEAVADYIDELNDDLNPVFPWTRPDKSESDGVISFSHFLPCQELIPEKRFLFFPSLHKAVGSKFLSFRVNRLKPDMHIFGHTHFGWDQTINGIRYIQAPLGYPRERKQRITSLTIGKSPSTPFLCWEDGAFVPVDFNAAWAIHYNVFPRNPKDTRVAEWVASAWRRDAMV